MTENQEANRSANGGGAMVPTGGGMFGEAAGVEMETAGRAAAAHAEAMVKAQYVMALQRPRDFDVVRSRLLRHCERPGFAKIARYSKPQGGKNVEGPSVRFVETALQEMANVNTSAVVVLEDPGEGTLENPGKRIVHVQVIDLERNALHGMSVTVPRTVERKAMDGRTPLSSRKNTKGETTYLLVATDDEMLQKTNALTSKALRNLGQKIIPRDILDECMSRAQQVARDQAAKDPDAERKWIADAFASLGIFPDKLSVYLGKQLSEALPDELVDLRALGQSIANGELTWDEAMAEKTGKSDDKPAATPPAKPADKPKTKAEAVTAKIEQKEQPKPQPATVANAPAPKHIDPTEARSKMIPESDRPDYLKMAVADGLITLEEAAREDAWAVVLTPKLPAGWLGYAEARIKDERAKAKSAEPSKEDWDDAPEPPAPPPPQKTAAEVAFDGIAAEMKTIAGKAKGKDDMETWRKAMVKGQHWNLLTDELKDGVKKAYRETLAAKGWA